MSDTPRVGIEVVVEGSQAEAGLGRIDAAVARTGRTLDTLGDRGAAALDSVSAHSTTAAGQMDASTRNIISQIQRQIATMEAGERGTRSYYESMTRLRGGNTDLLRPYLEQLDQVSARQAAARTGLNATAGSLGQVGVSARQTAAAMRGVPAQITDIVTSLQGGQAPLTVFLQQGGQLRDMFGSAGGAARALGSSVVSMISPLTLAAAAAAALGLAYYQGSKEADAYNRALVLTGNIAGTSAGQLADMARGISASVGTQGDAAAALAALAGTGAVASRNLQQFGEVAVRAQKTIGISVDETAKAFADLAKNPLAASQKLNDQYHYLTTAIYEQIRALEQQGKTQEAGELAQQSFAAALTTRTKGIEENLGHVERAWRSAGQVAKQAWDSFMDVGRAQTLDQKLASVQQQLKLARSTDSSGTGAASDWSEMRRAAARARIGALEQEQKELQGLIKAQKDAGAAAAATAKREEAGIQLSDMASKYLDKETQRQNALTAAREKAAAASVGVDEERRQKIQAQLKKVEAGINADVEKEAAAAAKKQLDERSSLAKAALEQQRALEKEVAAGTLADLESQHKQALISDDKYYAAKRDLQLKDLAADAALLKKQADRAKNKGDVTEQRKYLGEIEVLEQRRRNIIQGTQNAIDEKVSATTRALAEQARAWKDASADEAAQLRDELSLFGTNAEARKIATSQLKIEAEARQFQAAQVKAGRPLNEQQIADLQAEVRERQKNIAAIMGERQALAGAEQLHVENARFAAESILNERDRARALLEIDAESWRKRIELAAEGSEARKKLETEYAQWYQNQLAKPEIEAQRELWRGIESTAHDTFVSIFDSGKSAFDRLRDTLKNGLAELLYQMTIKKWIFNIEANVGASGGIADALRSGGSGGGSLGSLVSMGKSIFEGFSTGFSSIGSTLGGYVSSLGSTLGSSALSSFGAGMGMTTAQASTAANVIMSHTGNAAAASSVQAGSYVGAVAPWAAGLGAGVLGGRLISGGYSAFGGSGNGAVNAGTGIGAAVGILSGIGGPLGLAIGGIAAGVMNRAFGRKAPEVKERGIEGTVSASGFDGRNYANMVEKGGWFRSTKRYPVYSDLSAAQDTTFDTSITSMIQAVKGFGTVLGVETSTIDGYNKAIKLALTNDAAANDKAIADLFAGIGDELAGRLIPNLAEFAKTGEAASATLQRIAGDFQVVDTMLTTLGTTSQAAFGAVGLASVKAREQLVGLAGGAEALASQTTYFADNFLTAAEQIAPLAKSVGEKMSALGYAGVKTTEQYKASMLNLASSGALATAAGSETYATLLALAPAFKAVADAAAEATKEATAAKQALADGLLKGADSALSTLQQIVNREKAALQKAHEAELAALQGRITLQTEAVSKFKSLADSLKSTLSQMEVPGQAAGTRQQAQADIRTALAIARAGGPLPDADSLKDALSTVTKDASDQFSSYTDYMRDFYATAADVSGLEDLADSSLSVAEKTLAALNAQKDAADAAYEQQDAALNALVENGQKQLDLMKGDSSTLLTIAQGVAGMAQAIAAINANPIASAAATASSAYSTYLGRAPEAGAIDYWKNQASLGVDVAGAIKNSDEGKVQAMYQSLLGRSGESEGVGYYTNLLKAGVSLEHIQQAFMSSDEYKKLHPFAVGTNYVPKTMPALVHEGERIIPAADNRELMRALNQPAQRNDAALLAELRALREEVAELRKPMQQAADGSTGTRDLVYNISAGGNAFAVEVMNA